VKIVSVYYTVTSHSTVIVLDLGPVMTLKTKFGLTSNYTIPTLTVILTLKMIWTQNTTCSSSINVIPISMETSQPLNYSTASLPLKTLGDKITVMIHTVYYTVPGVTNQNVSEL
jgi:hypothetical protein